MDPVARFRGRGQRRGHGSCDWEIRGRSQVLLREHGQSAPTLCTPEERVRSTRLIRSGRGIIQCPRFRGRGQRRGHGSCDWERRGRSQVLLREHGQSTILRTPEERVRSTRLIRSTWDRTVPPLSWTRTTTGTWIL